MSDELDRVRDLRPSAPPPSRHLVATERKQLMSVIDREVHQDLEPTPAARRRWLIPGLALAALAGVAAGYALTRDVTTTTEISCPDGIVDAVSGDPVADCAQLWRQRKGSEPPELTAYDNRRGGVEVVPAGSEVPADWTALEPGLSQDARLIELDAALADWGDGLNARCYRPVEARRVAEAVLGRLGLVDWSVRIDGDRAGGEGTCATHVLDPETRKVVVFALETSPPPEEAPFRLLASSAQTQIDHRCLNRAEAVEAVRGIAAGLDLDEASGELVIHPVPDPSAACSRTDVNVGGRIEVTVRGS